AALLGRRLLQPRTGRRAARPGADVAGGELAHAGPGQLFRLPGPQAATAARPAPVAENRGRPDRPGSHMAPLTTGRRSPSCTLSSQIPLRAGHRLKRSLSLPSRLSKRTDRRADAARASPPRFRLPPDRVVTVWAASVAVVASLTWPPWAVATLVLAVLGFPA